MENKQTNNPSDSGCLGLFVGFGGGGGVPLLERRQNPQGTPRSGQGARYQPGENPPPCPAALGEGGRPARPAEARPERRGP